MNLIVMGEVVRGEHAAWRRCDLCRRSGEHLSECLILGGLWYDLCPACQVAAAQAPEPGSKAGFDRFAQSAREAAPPIIPRLDTPPITGGKPHRLQELHREYREREKTLVLVPLDTSNQPEKCPGCGTRCRLFDCHIWREKRIVARCRRCAIELAGGEAGIDVRSGARMHWRKQERI